MLCRYPATAVPDFAAHNPGRGADAVQRKTGQAVPAMPHRKQGDCD
jgi:hypothetical protein